jgi:acyl-CoA thioester hydrolase
MAAPSTVVEAALRVRYAETDAMGIVHHASYLIWFEVGRSEYFRQIGVSYEEVERRGYLFPLSEAYARYSAPARYGDAVWVRTKIAEARSRSLTFAYEVILQPTGATLVTGWTKHLCVDRQGQVQRIPEFLREAWEQPAASGP